MQDAEDQMTLFDHLPIPSGPAPERRRVVACALAVPAWCQLAFKFVLRPLERDVDDAFDFPRHVVVAAPEQPRPETRAPVSIFDLAAMVKASGLRSRGRFGGPHPDAPPKQRLTVQRADGVVKVVGAAYPGNRWDEERFEQERQRRARQKPPRPTKKAKTRGAKVRAWDGETIDD